MLWDDDRWWINRLHMKLLNKIGKSYNLSSFQWEGVENYFSFHTKIDVDNIAIRLYLANASKLYKLVMETDCVILFQLFPELRMHSRISCTCMHLYLYSYPFDWIWSCCWHSNISFIFVCIFIYWFDYAFEARLSDSVINCLLYKHIFPMKQQEFK